MNRALKITLTSLVFLIHIDANCQSIIKSVSGNIFQVIDDIEKPIEGFNTIVNDSITLKFGNNSYMIAEIDGQIVRIKSEDYKDGIQLKNFTNTIEADKPASLFAKILDLVYDRSFDNKKEIDGLKISSFQGVTRSISKKIDRRKVSPNYKSKLEWKHGINLQINSGSKNILTVIKEELKYFNIDQYVLIGCKPCYVKIDNEERGLIESVQLNNEYEKLLAYLFSNIDIGVDVEFSQFCIIRLLITQDLFMNANYYLDEFSDNKLIHDYLKYLELH